MFDVRTIHSIHRFVTFVNTQISLTKQKRNQSKYLPFGVGCVVKGNIYNIFGKHRFNITKIIEFSELSQEDYNNFISTSHNCKEFFRNNYEEIKKCMN